MLRNAGEHGRRDQRALDGDGVEGERSRTAGAIACHVD
jgi:hypothetical protein